MPWVTLSEALRLAAASQLLLLVVLILRDHRRSRVAPASSLFVACVVCYLVLPVLLQQAVPDPVGHLARAGALSVPFAFWLTARLYFDDAFHPTPLHGVLFLGLLLARSAALPWKLASAGIAMAVIADALRHIHTGANSDLLLSRLRLRYVVLLGTGVYALLVVVGEAAVERGSRADSLLSAANDVRNFNAFLNHYRVREARKLLADPGQKQLGVAEIAYRFGYSSLGPFNRAFKEIVGQTPTEFRKAAPDRELLADSGIGQASSKKS